MIGHTTGPWRVRTLERNGQVVDCFVCANDVQGHAYDAEIMGDDEYRDGIERKLADARLISAAPDLLAALKHLLAEHERWINDEYSGTGLEVNLMSELDYARKAIARATEGKL